MNFHGITGKRSLWGVSHYVGRNCRIPDTTSFGRQNVYRRKENRMTRLSDRYPQIRRDHGITNPPRILLLESFPIREVLRHARTHNGGECCTTLMFSSLPGS
jgi:hypothetical protein